MHPSSPRALTYPWSLWDPATSQPFLTGDRARLDANGVDTIATPDTWTLRVDRASTGCACTGTSTSPDGRRWKVWEIAAPTKSGGQAVTHVHVRDGTSPESPVEVDRVGALARPVHRRSSADPAAISLDNLIAVQVDRIEALIQAGERRVAETGVMRGLVRPTWDDVVDTLLKPDDVGEPTMALIVQHATTLRTLVRDLAERPRKILRRVRERDSIQRIREMDAGCLRSYVRQPGRTPAEKAGPTQRLVAVVRKETHDTLENRVLVDFLGRSAQEADAYRRANGARSESSRYADVRRYGTLVRSLGRRPELEDVAPPSSLPAPNYVLLRDRRYAKMWNAYLELVRRKDVLDEAWSWQRNLWRDFTTLSFLAAPMAHAVSTTEDRDGYGFAERVVRTVSSTPLYLRKEQDRGHWMHSASLARTFLWDDGRPSVVRMSTPLRGDGAPAGWHPDRRDAALHADLRPDVRVDVVPLDGGRPSTGLVWAVHFVSSDEVDPEEAAASAHRACERWASSTGGRRPRGLVVALGHDPYAPAIAARSGAVDALRVPIAGSHISQTLRHYSNWIGTVASDVDT